VNVSGFGGYAQAIIVQSDGSNGADRAVRFHEVIIPEARNGLSERRKQIVKKLSGGAPSFKAYFRSAPGLGRLWTKYRNRPRLPERGATGRNHGKLQTHLH
jgi:hypothetical protein